MFSLNGMIDLAKSANASHSNIDVNGVKISAGGNIHIKTTPILVREPDLFNYLFIYLFLNTPYFFHRDTNF